MDRRRFLLNAVALGGIPFLHGCGGGSGSGSNSNNVATPQKTFSVTQNGSISAEAYPVRYDDFQNPTLLTLRSQENLDSLFLPTDSEFDRFLKLKNWVSSQWPDGNPNPYPPWNAVTILDWIRSGRTGGFCAQFAQVMLQALLSFGYIARYIEIGLDSNPYAHFILEVWSNQYNKWVVFDPDYNVYFEKDGFPLSAREVHYYQVTSQQQLVTTVQGTVHPGHPTSASWVHGMVELYYYVRFFEKADHLANPNNPFVRYQDAVEWKDVNTVPWELSTVVSPYAKEVLTLQSTTDALLFEHKENQVQASIASSSITACQISLTNNMVQFDHYYVEELGNGQVLNDAVTAQSTYTWNLQVGADAIRIYAVNVMGVKGVPVSISYA